MNAVGMALDAMDSKLVLAACSAVVLFVSLILIALIGHVVMKTVRKTAIGQWASSRSEAQMDRVRAAYAARKRTKAGAP